MGRKTESNPQMALQIRTEFIPHRHIVFTIDKIDYAKGAHLARYLLFVQKLLKIELENLLILVMFLGFQFCGRLDLRAPLSFFCKQMHLLEI